MAENTSHPLLTGLARAVRARRDALKLSLRTLSETAGVSERFLAQVEAGEGNISVVRLAGLAQALHTDAAQLLADAQQATDAPVRGMIALVGLRGAGKTTLGTRAAEQLGVAFFELDKLVERAAGMDLTTLFEMRGTEHFRQLERDVLRDLIAREPRGVLATSGGIVTDAQTYETLRRGTVTVWLRARAEDHLARVIAQGDVRPMKGHDNALEDIRRLLRARGPLYEKADHVVDTSGVSASRALQRLMRVVRGAGTAQRG